MGTIDWETGEWNGRLRGDEVDRQEIQEKFTTPFVSRR